jgi:3-methyladenine DNA glycosylase AlkD
LEPQTIKDPETTLELSGRWINSSDLWTKRFGVVALRAFKKAPITKKVFELLDRVMSDDEHYIKKAVGWILREISKQDPMRVYEYLMCYASEGADKATRWIIKDGMKKLPPEEQTSLKAKLGE